MKKTGKIFVSIASLGLLLNNVSYAATEAVEEKGGSSKFIFIGVAALVIVLLLFLGYKMDTKGIEKPAKLKKAKQKLTAKAKEKSDSYDEDEDEDEEEFDNEDLNEKVEYDEDEDSLFAASNEEDEEPSILEDDSTTTVDTSAVRNNLASEPETEPEPEEEYGEEFDTSIIDVLDDEDAPLPESEEPKAKKVAEETMLFDSGDLEKSSEKEVEEIDSAAMDEGMKALELEGNRDTFIEELKNFEEPESNFEGFSKATKETVEEIVEEDKPKKEDKVKEETSFSGDNEFLSQLEANLQKNKADRDAKKAGKTTTSTSGTAKKNTKNTKKK